MSAAVWQHLIRPLRATAASRPISHFRCVPSFAGVLQLIQLTNHFSLPAALIIDLSDSRALRGGGSQPPHTLGTPASPTLHSSLQITT